MNRIVEWLLGLVALGVASLMINLVLLVLKIGNLKTILFIRKLRSALSELPGEVLLSCTGDQVSAVTFDMSQSRERIIPFYSGILIWKGSPRSASRVLAQGTKAADDQDANIHSRIHSPHSYRRLDHAVRELDRDIHHRLASLPSVRAFLHMGISCLLIAIARRLIPIRLVLVGDA